MGFASTWMVVLLNVHFFWMLTGCGGGGGGNGNQNGNGQPNPNSLANILVGQWVEDAFIPLAPLTEKIDALYNFRLAPNAIPPQFLGTGFRQTFVLRMGALVETSRGDYYWGLSGNTLILVFSSGREERFQITVQNNNTLFIRPSFGPGIWQRVI